MENTDKKKQKKNLLKTVALFAGAAAFITLVDPFIKVATRSTETVADSFFVNNKYGLIHFSAGGTGHFSPMSESLQEYDFTWREKQGFIETKSGDSTTDWSRFDYNKILDVDDSVIYVHVAGGL